MPNSGECWVKEIRCSKRSERAWRVSDAQKLLVTDSESKKGAASASAPSAVENEDHPLLPAVIRRAGATGAPRPKQAGWAPAGPQCQAVFQQASRPLSK